MVRSAIRRSTPSLDHLLLLTIAILDNMALFHHTPEQDNVPVPDFHGTAIDPAWVEAIYETARAQVSKR